MEPEVPSGPNEANMLGYSPTAKRRDTKMSKVTNIPIFENGIIGAAIIIKELIPVVKVAPSTLIPISPNATRVRS